MTEREFAARMLQCSLGMDTEGKHVVADRLMCEVLRALGYEKGVKIFEAMPKWYS